MNDDTSTPSSEPLIEEYCESYIREALVLMLNFRADRYRALESASERSVEENIELSRLRRIRARMGVLQAEAETHTPEVTEWLKAEVWRLYEDAKKHGVQAADAAEIPADGEQGQFARMAKEAMERRGRPWRELREAPKGERPVIAEPHPPRPEMGDYGSRPDGSANLLVVKMVKPPFDGTYQRHVYHAGLVCSPRTARHLDDAYKLARAMVAANSSEWMRGAAIWIEPAILSVDTMPGFVSRRHTRETGLPAT